MAKTLIEIPNEVIAQLDVLAKEKSVSRSVLIRKAIDDMLKELKKPKGKKAFGILKDKLAGDSVDYQRKLRNEWK